MTDKPTYKELEERIRELEERMSKYEESREKIIPKYSFLDTVFEMSPFSLWISDNTGTVIHTNRYLRETIKLNDEEIIGKYNVLKDENLKISGVMPKVRNVFKNLEPARFKTFWTADLAGDVDFTGGRDMYIDVSMYPILDENEQLKNVVCQWIDISDLKQTEKALLASEKLHRKLFDDAPVPLWEEDFTGVFNAFKELEKKGVTNFREFFNENPDQVISLSRKVNILNVNRETLKLHDAESKDQLIGNLNKIFTENSLIAFKEELISLASGAEEFEVESEVAKMSGGVKHIHLNLSLDKDRSDNRTIVLLSTIDITERIKAQEKQKRLQTQLAQAQKMESIGNPRWWNRT